MMMMMMMIIIIIIIIIIVFYWNNLITAEDHVTSVTKTFFSKKNEISIRLCNRTIYVCIYLFTAYLGNLASSTDIETDYGLNGRVRFPVGTRDLSLLHGV
jgi:nitric oxide reductase large subunit